MKPTTKFSIRQLLAWFFLACVALAVFRRPITEWEWASAFNGFWDAFWWTIAWMPWLVNVLDTYPNMPPASPDSDFGALLGIAAGVIVSLFSVLSGVVVVVAAYVKIARP